MNISDIQNKISNIIEQIYGLNSNLPNNYGLFDIELATYHLRVLKDDLELERENLTE